MHRFLQHDEASGELRLVMTDTYDGQHERDEFRVVDQDGRPMRRRPELEGLPVMHEWGPDGSRYYIHMGPFRTRRNVSIEQTAVGPTERTPCPKAENRRRKCALCA